MRSIVFALALSLWSLPVFASEDRIQTVITSQIEAFQRDDFDEAFSYASPTIKDLFGSPERFGAMVRGGYPMVWRPSNVEFLDLKAQGAQTVQEVLITDSTGALHVLAYYMVETADGWQIAGVQLLRAPQVGA